MIASDEFKGWEREYDPFETAAMLRSLREHDAQWHDIGTDDEAA